MGNDKKPDDEMIGFKDFIDFTEENQKKKANIKDQSASFELFTFLDQESQRLSKRIRLFEEKTYMLRNFPQDIALIVRQEESNMIQRQKLISKLKKRGSPLFDSMREIFEDHFR